MLVAVLGISISANAQWGYIAPPPSPAYICNSYNAYMNQWQQSYNQAQQQFNNYMKNVSQQAVNVTPSYNYNTTSSDYDTQSSHNNHSSHNHHSKDCHICHGSGVCQTCGGDGYQSSGFGLGDIPCANCMRVNGNRTGKCSVCRGTGKVN